MIEDIVKEIEQAVGKYIKGVTIKNSQRVYIDIDPSKIREVATYLWKDRGDVVSAEYAVNYGIELILDLVYALNKSFLLAPKWRFGYTRTLSWLPTEFEQHMKEAIICKELSDEDAHRRALSLKEIWPEFLEKAENDFGLSRDEVRRVYIKAVYGT